MIEFQLPSLGADMDEGTLLEWKVKPGDVVVDLGIQIVHRAPGKRGQLLHQGDVNQIAQVRAVCIK